MRKRGENKKLTAACHWVKVLEIPDVKDICPG